MNFITELTDFLAFYDVSQCIFLIFFGSITITMGIIDLASWQFFVATIFLIGVLIQPYPAYLEARRCKAAAIAAAAAAAAEAARRRQEDEAAARAPLPFQVAHTAFRWGEALLPIAASLAIGGAALAMLFTGKPLPPAVANVTNYLDRADQARRR